MINGIVKLINRRHPFHKGSVNRAVIAVVSLISGLSQEDLLARLPNGCFTCRFVQQLINICIKLLHKLFIRHILRISEASKQYYAELRIFEYQFYSFLYKGAKVNHQISI
ncbi:hypothetical protein HMF3257_35150 [Spirosoma telluris]|uniref:Uncharacterized protein n=1 Tax=Spirosoma telluris TaxID=2183553 RepID=A0A327NRP9_9BACT|nr:hypothetical protein HMF3257_35150 [Spirosoma telluris]